MSVRAYRVINIETAHPNSFNLWHDSKLVDFFDQEYGFFEKLGDEGQGLTELPVEALERAIAEVEMDDEAKEALQKDIEFAREQDEDYVQYYCF